MRKAVVVGMAVVSSAIGALSLGGATIVNAQATILPSVRGGATGAGAVTTTGTGTGVACTVTTATGRAGTTTATAGGGDRLIP